MTAGPGRARPGEGNRCCCPPELVGSDKGLVQYGDLVQSVQRAGAVLREDAEGRPPPGQIAQRPSTFFMTVVRVTRLKDWKIMPMPRRKERRLLPCRDMTSVPSTVSVPELMSCIRFIVRMSVTCLRRRGRLRRRILPVHGEIYVLELSKPLEYFLLTFLNSIIAIPSFQMREESRGLPPSPEKMVLKRISRRC